MGEKTKQFTITYEGLKEREQELEMLKTERRKEVAEKIKQAMAFGDLSENFEYDEAKNEQAQVEQRIATLEHLLKHAKIIDEDEIVTDRVSLGSRVKILDVEYNEELEYAIVGSTEADPAKFRLSDESPVGHALLGHTPGDDVEVETPGGTVIFKILAIDK